MQVVESDESAGNLKLAFPTLGATHACAGAKWAKLSWTKRVVPAATANARQNGLAQLAHEPETKPWRAADDRKLREAHGNLDPTHPEFWQFVAQQVGRDAEDCVRRWEFLAQDATYKHKEEDTTEVDVEKLLARKDGARKAKDVGKFLKQHIQKTKQNPKNDIFAHLPGVAATSSSSSAHALPLPNSPVGKEDDLDHISADLPSPRSLQSETPFVPDVAGRKESTETAVVAAGGQGQGSVKRVKLDFDPNIMAQLGGNNLLTPIQESYDSSSGQNSIDDRHRRSPRGSQFSQISQFSQSSQGLLGTPVHAIQGREVFMNNRAKIREKEERQAKKRRKRNNLSDILQPNDLSGELIEAGLFQTEADRRKMLEKFDERDKKKEERLREKEDGVEQYFSDDDDDDEQVAL